MRRNKLNINTSSFGRIMFLFAIAFLLFTNALTAQVTTSIDSTKIKIGEQITYKIQVETDTTKVVVFPEGQTFLPLEMIESYKIDTTKKDATYKLIKKYGLTQFDSGSYLIPRQKIIVGKKEFFTDSMRVEVNNVKVDTTKQKLYDIKPIIEVDKKGSNWWKYLLIALLAIGLVAFLLYWFIWRQKPLTEEERVALLPSYDRAKLAVNKLRESNYLEHSEIKKYYSELTLIIRAYIDEKVYDHALESTTDELIDRLNLLKDGNQFDFTPETIKNLETILKRADLVKFAKSAPDVELAKLDLETISKEVDSVKAVLPEPTEEEKLLDQQYRETQERKKKRRKIIWTVLISLLLIIATGVGFGIKYGFKYTTDKIIADKTLSLLEGNWVKSEYGFPVIDLETPEVLSRIETEIPEELKDKINKSVFIFGGPEEKISIVVGITQIVGEDPDSDELSREELAARNYLLVTEGELKNWEEKGIRNIITITEEFITPNGGEGIKTFGTADFPLPDSDKFIKQEYTILTFTSERVVQQIIISIEDGNLYAKEILDRILKSVEVIDKKPEEEQNQQE